MIESINEMKSWFFEKMNNIDKLLARFIKNKDRTQINKIRSEKGEVTMDITEKTKDHKRLLYATIRQ